MVGEGKESLNFETPVVNGKERKEKKSRKLRIQKIETLGNERERRNDMCYGVRNGYAREDKNGDSMWGKD